MKKGRKVIRNFRFYLKYAENGRFHSKRALDNLTYAEKYFIQKLTYANKTPADILDFDTHYHRGERMNINWQEEYEKSWDNSIPAAYNFNLTRKEEEERKFSWLDDHFIGI